MVDHHEDRLLRSRGGGGGPEIILLTPLLNTNQKKEEEHGNSTSFAIYEVIDTAMMGDEEDQREKRATGHLLQSWKNHRYRAAAVVRHVWHHNYDPSSKIDLVWCLLGGQWILPILLWLTTGLVLEAAVLHWQVLWIRYALLLPSSSSSSSSSSSNDDDNNRTTTGDILPPHRQRRIAGCFVAALLIHLPAIRNSRWGEYHDGEDESEYWILAVGVLWANAILFLLVRGGQLEYAMPTLLLLLTPFWGTYLIGYMFISIAANFYCCGSCNIAALFRNLEDAHYQSARFAADEAKEQEALRRQMAGLAHLETDSMARRALRPQLRWHMTLMKNCHVLGRLAFGLVILFLGLQYGTSLWYRYGFLIENVFSKDTEGYLMIGGSN
jgi:hypothetical protein